MVPSPVNTVDVEFLPSRLTLKTQEMLSLYVVMHCPHGQSIFELMQFHEPFTIA
jgi:hypothetical protein